MIYAHRPKKIRSGGGVPKDVAVQFVLPPSPVDIEVVPHDEGLNGPQV